TRNRLFVAELPGAGAAPVASATAISGTLDGDVPGKPFGGAEDYAWAPDGRSVVASIKVAGREEPWSTDFDLYRLDAAGRAAPECSPDGGPLFYRAMARPGFEADRFALMALDLASGERREIAPGWDRSPSSLQPSADGTALYVAAQDTGEYPLFKVDVATGEVTRLVDGGSVSAYEVAGPTLVFSRNAIDTGDVIYAASTEGEGVRAITPTAAERLPDVDFGAFEQFSFQGAGGATVYGYVVKPWNYQAGQRYPVAFLIHG